jgi:CheY-like chemotaxis protein
MLLVEDQEDDAILIKRALEESGIKYPIHTVRSGLGAMSYLSGDPPFHDRDRYPLPLLLLLDIRMPGPDGFEVLRWIRHNPEFSKLPVVMLTSSDAIQDADAAYRLGATSFFVKPFDFANTRELSQALKRLVAKGAS